MHYEIIKLPKIHDTRGNLSFLQKSEKLPFTIERVFWTYDVPSGATRGGHAYRSQHELIIALSGSFDVIITLRNREKFKLSLNRGDYGLYISPMTWRQMENFSTNSLGLHLSSQVYNEQDYIRDFNHYFSE